jgi:hypothetical protein
MFFIKRKPSANPTKKKDRDRKKKNTIEKIMKILKESKTNS